MLQPLLPAGLMAVLLLVSGSYGQAAPDPLPSGIETVRLASPIRLAPRGEAAAGVPHPSICGLSVADDAMTTLAGVEHAVLEGFPLDAANVVSLDVHRMQVMAPGAKIVAARIEGGKVVERELQMPAVHLFSGSVLGRPESHVFLSFATHAVQGFIRIDDRTHIISSGPSLPGMELDPVIFDVQGVPEEVLKLGGFTCGFDEIVQPNLPRFEVRKNPAPGASAPDGGDGGLAGGPPAICRQTQMAIETDFEYLNSLFGGNTDAATVYANTLIGAVTEIYTAELNVRFQISFLRLWETADDPWTAGGTSSQLNQFRNYWNENMADINRSLGHFLSGRSLGGGVAWLAVVCHADLGYALSANLAGFFPYPIEDNHPLNWDIVVVAHELGHNFGTVHTHNYNPPIDGCGLDDCSLAADGTIMSYCHLCTGGMSNIALTLHPIVIDTIIEYMESGSIPCDMSGIGSAPFAPTDSAVTVPDEDVDVDILGNDIPSNCAHIAMTGFDAVSDQGATITLLDNAGPDGRDMLRYSPAPGFVGQDAFNYTITDDEGLTALGLVNVEVAILRPSDAPLQTQPGVKARYYNVVGAFIVPDFDTMTPFLAGLVPNIEYGGTADAFAGSGLSENVGASFRGYIDAPVSGYYTLFTTSDDGSMLYVGDTLVVDNDGLHGMQERSGSIGLQAGRHEVRVDFFENSGGCGLIVRWVGPGIPKQVIPAANWSTFTAADVTEDGRVDIDDLFALIDAWGACAVHPTVCPGDVIPNGTVNIDDLFSVLAAWD